MSSFVFLILGFFLIPSISFSAPAKTTYQARIIKPDGQPLQAANVSFRFTITNPTGQCVLYSEDYTLVNMSGSGGQVNFSLGNGVVNFASTSGTQRFAEIFDNTRMGGFVCKDTTAYVPTSNDIRKIVMQFNDGNGWQTLPAMAINSVPFSMFASKAEDTKKFDGKTVDQFAQVQSLPSCTTGQQLQFNGINFSCVTPAASGLQSFTSNKPSILQVGGSLTNPTIDIQVATASSSGYLLSSDFVTFSGKMNSTASAVISALGFTPISSNTARSIAQTEATDIASAAVASAMSSQVLAGDVSGNFASTIVDQVGGKSSSQISNSVNDTQLATANNTASVIAKRTSDKGILADYFELYRPSSSFAVRLSAPTSLAASYTLTLPNTQGSNGQVLAVDNSGQLNWINPSTGSVTSVTGTSGQLVTTGTSSSVTIGLATTGVTSATYGSANKIPVLAVDSFGRVQSAGVVDFQDATSSQKGLLQIGSNISISGGVISITNANVVSALGYTPADQAAVTSALTNYAQRVNNLSDLTDLSQARTNLGLQALALKSDIDLSTSDATGILPLSKLPSGVLTSATALAGDVTGNYNTNSINTIQGRAVSLAALSNGQILQVSGSAVRNITLPSCAANQYLTFNGTSWSCANDAGSAGSVSSLSQSGPITLSASTGAVTIGFSNSGVNAGIYGATNTVPVFTVDQYGRITGVTSATTSVDWANITSKPTTLSGFGITDALSKSANLGDLASSATARSNLGLGTLATASSIDLSTASATGILSTSKLPALTGDVTSTAGSNSLTVAKIQGQSVSFTALANNNILQVSGTNIVNRPIPTCSANQYLSFNGSAWVCSNDAGASGTVADITANSPLSVNQATGSVVLSLNNSGVTSNTYGSASSIPTFNVDAFGRITFASSVAYQDATSAVKGILRVPAGSNLTLTAGDLSLTNSNVVSALGYVPASNTALGNYLTKANNLNDLASSATARSNLGLGALATASSIDLSTASATGILSTSKLPALTGDVTSTAGSNSLTVTKLQGQSVSFTALANNNILQVSGTNIVNRSIPTCLANQYLTFNGSAWVCSNDAGASGTVSDITANSPLSVNQATGSVVLSLNNSGVTSNTYGSASSVPTFNVDAFGRLTFASSIAYQDASAVSKGVVRVPANANLTLTAGDLSLTNSNVVSALGYTPANSTSLANYVLKTGDTMTGALDVSSTVKATDFVFSNLATAVKKHTFTQLVNLGKIKPLAQFTAEEGAISLLIQVQSKTNAHSGTKNYIFQGGFSQVSTSWAKMIPHNTGRGHGNSIDGFDLYIRRNATNNYAYEFGVAANTTNKTLVTTFINLGLEDSARGTAFVDLSANIEENQSSVFDVYSHRQIFIENQIGLGRSTATAKLHITSGAVTAGSAPLKLTSGTLMTTPEAGAIEYDGTNYYITFDGNQRRIIATEVVDGTLDSTSVISNNLGNITLVPTNSVVVSSTQQSNSSTTGALVVGGGVGVAGNIFASGTIVTSSNIQAASITATSGLSTNVIQGNSNLLLNPNTGNVGVGTSNPGAKFDVNGMARAVQFNQNTTSSGNTSIAVNSFIFTANPATAPASSTIFYQNQNIYEVSGSVSMANATSLNGFNRITFTNPTSIATLGSLHGYATNSGTGTVNLMYGLRGTSENNSTGTINRALGGLFIVNNNSTSTVSEARLISSELGTNAGTIDTLLGLAILGSSSGTVNTSYGIKIEALPGTTKYGVFQNDSAARNVFLGNLGIGTTNPNTNSMLQISSANQSVERIRFTGQEFYQAGNSDTNGLSFLLGVNRPGNRQLWLADSANLTQNASNTVLRFSPSSGDISALATDGLTTKNLLLNSNGGNVGIGTTSASAPLTVQGNGAGVAGVFRTTAAASDRRATLNIVNDTTGNDQSTSVRLSMSANSIPTGGTQAPYWEILTDEQRNGTNNFVINSYGKNSVFKQGLRINGDTGAIKVGGRNANYFGPCINGNVFSLTSYDASGVDDETYFTNAKEGTARISIKAFAGASCTGYFYAIYPQIMVRDSPKMFYWNLTNLPEQNPTGSYQILISY